MNKEFEEKIQETKKIKLTEEEKLHAKNALIALMGKHKKPSIFAQAFGSVKFILKPAYIVIFIFIAGGTGTAFAAETSLPGDVLYPIKTGVVEEIREVFTFTDEQKAVWTARRAERRLEEMQKLEEKNQLKQEIIERVENNFQRHEEKVDSLIRKLEENNNPNAAKIKVRLQNSIEVHKEMLKRLEDKKQRLEKKSTEKFEKLEKPKNPENPEKLKKPKNPANPTKNPEKINKPPQDNTSHNKFSPDAKENK